MRQLARQYKLPLWMTEYSSPSYQDWHSSFDWAVRMHTLLTDGGVNAVDYLWGFFGSWVKSDTMLSITFENGDFRSYAPTPIYWITGQYSRFVRPGYVRVGATSSSDQVLVSAYKSGTHVVIVVSNPSVSSHVARLGVTGGTLTGTVRQVQSSSTEHWSSLGPLRVRSGSFTASLPPQSITTLLVERKH
jgi:glucuronoarabinoxylan endo-1,4-beta-xylanase